MSDRARTFLSSQAAWAELESAISLLVSATLRNKAEEADACRAKAHDLLDLHMDNKIASLTAIRLDLERDTRGR